MPSTKQPLGIPKLPWSCLCARGFCCLKLTPKIFSCVQKPHLSWNSLLITSGKQLHIGCYVDHSLMTISQTPPNKSLEPSSNNVYYTQPWKTRHNWELLWEATPDFFPTEASPMPRVMQPLGCPVLPSHCLYAAGFCCVKYKQMCSLVGRRLIWLEIAFFSKAGKRSM